MELLPYMAAFLAPAHPSRISAPFFPGVPVSLRLTRTDLAQVEAPLSSVDWRIVIVTLVREMGAGALRGAQLAGLSSSREPVHRRLRLSDAGAPRREKKNAARFQAPPLSAGFRPRGVRADAAQ